MKISSHKLCSSLDVQHTRVYSDGLGYTKLVIFPFPGGVVWMLEILIKSLNECELHHQQKGQEMQQLCF